MAKTRAPSALDHLFDGSPTESIVYVRKGQTIVPQTVTYTVGEHGLRAIRK